MNKISKMLSFLPVDKNIIYFLRFYLAYQNLHSKHATSKKIYNNDNKIHLLHGLSSRSITYKLKRNCYINFRVNLFTYATKKSIRMHVKN